MKTALHKSAIPDSKIFVVKQLNENHFDPTWHAHPEYQLFFVEEGTGTRFIGDSIKLFKPGELVFTGPHLPHLWRSDEKYFDRNNSLKTSGMVIYLNEHFLGEDILNKEEFILVKKLFSKSLRGIEFQGETKTRVVKMMKDLLKMQGIEKLIQLLKILSCLANCKNIHYISPEAYTSSLNQSETDRMNQVYDFILKNYRKKITLGQIANVIHMTPTSFSRYFSIINNKPFSKFITQIRIKHACKMLVETDETIANICYDSGFNTLSNFNQQFKDVMSTTPMDYRKEFLNL